MSPAQSPPLLRRYVDIETGREAGDLLAFAGPGRTLDPGGVSDLLAFGYLAGRRTLLRGVERRLEPWTLPPPSPHPRELDPGAREDRLWELLVAAVGSACEGHPRPRAALSGGLDSRAVSAALSAWGGGGSAGTFGDPDCADLPVAEVCAARLGLAHEVSLLSPDVALRHEERVWRATGGTGGPASAPGAATDGAWAERCDVLLSGASGDVVWGASRRPGPSPERRLRKLGVRFVPPTWDDEAPSPPPWTSEPGARAWRNLWTRQAGGTWNGVLPRLPFTPVVPVLWSAPLLAFCLALEDDDRRERALVRRALERHAPAVATSALPLAPRGPVHDLDRAVRGAAWAAELDDWLRRTDFEAVGLSRRGVRRLVRKIRAGRDRSATLSRVRALSRWAALLGD